MADPTADKQSGQRPGHRRRRFLLRAAAVVIVLIILGALLITQTPICGRFFIPGLERALGMDLAAGWMRISPAGRLIVTDLSVSVPGVQGTAGRCLEADHLSAGIDWAAALRGQQPVRSVRIKGWTARLSQSVEDQSFNISGLAAASGPGQRGGPSVPGASAPFVPRLPSVMAEDGVLELGESRRGAYTALKTMRVAGSLVPDEDSDRYGYLIHLRQTDPPDVGGHPVTLEGRLDEKELNLELRDVSLADWKPDSTPSAYRDLISDLEMKGRITSAALRSSRETGLVAAVSLDGVALNLPFKSADDPERRLRMTENNGLITFVSDAVRLVGSGMIGDLPYSVDLQYEGTSANSAFKCTLMCEKFRLEENPELAPFTPRIVRKRLRTFSDPTGLVSTRVEITRAPPGADGTPGPIAYEGTIEFTEGAAAFDEFPYPFADMQGTIRFNQDRVVIDSIAGTAANGAKLGVTGLVQPLDWTANVDLDIKVTDVPIDDALIRALGEDRREAVVTLFNRDRFDELVEAGLIRAPGSGPASDAPEFAMGGLAELDITIHRQPELEGTDEEWLYDIDMRMPRAGLLPEAFPLPLYGRDLRLRIDNTSASLLAGEFAGLTGGTAGITAEVGLQRDPATGKEFHPDVWIRGRDVPADALLIHALPGDADDPPERYIRQLGVSGVASAEVHVLRRADGKIGFDAVVDPTGLQAHTAPRADLRRLIATEPRGSATVNEHRLDIDLTAAADWVSPGGTASSAGRITVRAGVDFPDGDALTAYDVALDGSSVAIAAPIEDAVKVFSAGAAAAIEDLRERYSPRGTCAIQGRFTGDRDGSAHSDTRISELRDVAFDLMDGRGEVSDSEGLIRIEADGVGPLRITFDGLTGSAAFDGEPAGRLALSGSMLRPHEPGTESEVRIALTNAMFGSSLTHRLVDVFTPERLRRWFKDAGPAGEYDLRLRTAPAAPDTPAPLRGSIEPRSLEFTSAGRRIAFDRITGTLSFGQHSGWFQDLSATADGWSARANGTWRALQDGEVEFDAGITVEGDVLTPSLRAALPAPVRTQFDALDLDADGPIVLRDAELRVVSPREGPVRVSFAGAVDARGVRLNVGLGITEADGSVEIEYDDDGGAPTFLMEALVDRFRLSGITMTGGRARIVSGSAPGRILVPLLSASCHGGRVAGEAELHPVPGGTDARSFNVSAKWTGLGHATLLDELAEAYGSEEAQRRLRRPDDATRVSGNLSLAGVSGDPSALRGRGTIQVAGGRVLRLPLTTPLLEVANLEMPSNEMLDYASLDMFIRAGTVTFDTITVISSTIELFGYGTMSWPGLLLDLRFESHRARSIPILSDLVWGIREQLVTVRVTGRLGEHQIRLETLQAARRIVEDVFGEGSAGPVRTLSETERRAQAERRFRFPRESPPMEPTTRGDDDGDR